MYLFVKLVVSKCGVQEMDFYENVAFLKHVKGEQLQILDHHKLDDVKLRFTNNTPVLHDILVDTDFKLKYQYGSSR